MKLTDLVLTRNMRVAKVLKESKAAMFKDCMTGDILHFSIKFNQVGRNSRGTRAAYVTIKNMRTSAETHVSFNQAYQYNGIVELEEV